MSLESGLSFAGWFSPDVVSDVVLSGGFGAQGLSWLGLPEAAFVRRSEAAPACAMHAKQSSSEDGPALAEALPKCFFHVVPWGSLIFLGFGGAGK